jgi:hypothetical protein
MLILEVMGFLLEAPVGLVWLNSPVAIARRGFATTAGQVNLKYIPMSRSFFSFDLPSRKSRLAAAWLSSMIHLFVLD